MRRGAALAIMLLVLTAGARVATADTAVVRLHELTDLLSGETRRVDAPARDEVIRVLQDRLRAFGWQAEIRPAAEDRLILTAELEPSALSTLLGRLEFREPISEDEWRVALDGRHVARAEVIPMEGGFAVVQFQLTPEGKAAFASLTSRLVGKSLGVYWGERELFAVRVMEPIASGTAQIHLGAAGMEPEQLATMLNLDELPLRLELLTDE
ncbi:MAG: hypothetical protein HY319_25365 [Armatimonadetes bacterium]|nr:hypothetical protein [Armatimonadota bacterium]